MGVVFKTLQYLLLSTDFPSLHHVFLITLHISTHMYSHVIGNPSEREILWYLYKREKILTRRLGTSLSIRFPKEDCSLYIYVEALSKAVAC